MNRELEFVVEEHRRIMIGLGERITEAFQSEEAAALIDPCVWVFLHLDPPAIEVVERMQIVGELATAKPTRFSPDKAPTLEPSERLVAISNEGVTFRFHIPDPRVHPQWYTYLAADRSA